MASSKFKEGSTPYLLRYGVAVASILITLILRGALHVTLDG